MIRDRIMTPAQTAGAQLAVSVVTGVLTGKQLKTMMKPAYRNAKALMGRAKRPRLQRARGSSSPLMRLSRTQPMDIMYVDMSARRDRETIMLKASVEPRLIRQRTALPTEER